MQLNPIASTILVVTVVLALLGMLVLGALIAWLLAKANALAEKGQQMVEPILDKADTLLVTATEKVEEIGGKTGAILGEGEATAEVVRTRVERAANAVQTTVAKPVVGVNALVAGVQRGAETFVTLQGWRRNGGKSSAEAAQIGNPSGNGSVSKTISTPADDEYEEIAPVRVAVAVGNAGAAAAAGETLAAGDE